jgi:hypothetical protein
MSCVFRNIDPSPPGASVSPPPRLWCAGRTHSLGGEGGGGSIVRKTPDKALYVLYICKYFAGVSIDYGRNIAINEDQVYCFAPMFTYTLCSINMLPMPKSQQSWVRSKHPPT